MDEWFQYSMKSILFYHWNGGYTIANCVSFNFDLYLGCIFPSVYVTAPTLCFFTCTPNGLHNSMQLHHSVQLFVKHTCPQKTKGAT